MASTTEPYASLASIERREMADFLTTLTPEQWATPSLCAGWSVREVVAHLSMPYRYSMPQFAWQIIKHRGFDSAANADAVRTAKALTPVALIQVLRDNIDNRWLPPGGGPAAALMQDVIHGLDILEPLGCPRTPSIEAMTAVANGLTSLQKKGFGFDLAANKLVATNAPVELGEGTVREMPVKDVLLTITGRKK